MSKFSFSHNNHRLFLYICFFFLDLLCWNFLLIYLNLRIIYLCKTRRFLIGFFVKIRCISLFQMVIIELWRNRRSLSFQLGDIQSFHFIEFSGFGTLVGYMAVLGMKAPVTMHRKVKIHRAWVDPLSNISLLLKVWCEGWFKERLDRLFWFS